MLSSSIVCCNYLQDEQHHLDKKKASLPDISDRELAPTQRKTPLQHNGKFFYCHSLFWCLDVDIIVCCVVVYSSMISLFPPPFSRLLMFFNIIRYDCSVFACIIVDFLSIDLPLTFNQSYIDQIRENITLSIMRGQ